MSFHVQTKHKAAKDHNCEWCNKTIESSQLYIKTTGSQDGEFYSYKFHIRCDVELTYTNAFLITGHCELFDDTKEYWNENLSDNGYPDNQDFQDIYKKSIVLENQNATK